MSGKWNFDTTYTSLPSAFYRRMDPKPVPKPELVLFNDELAEDLGLDREALQREAGVRVLAGGGVPDGGTPLAMAYAGHQFGGFTMLGDGRALLLGEHVTPSGKRVDIHLKGSGPTPFSRGGDGRAALGPMVREYIVSEAMHGLRIPTTRSLAVATTGKAVFRRGPLPGAVLTRVAASHLRVGTFQFAATWHGPDAVRALADYTLQRHFPALTSAEDPYIELLRVVARRQAELVAGWQAVGFIHGVMNTDNVTMSGETIDYGPCAFMEAYDPDTVFSSIDEGGRYAYGRQPPIAQWNLARFAETLLPLLHPEEEKAIEAAQQVISEFPSVFRRQWLARMRSKLGLSDEDGDDEGLIDDLLQLMQRHQADYTNVFRALTLLMLGERDEREGSGTEALFASDAWDTWYRRWRKRWDRGAVEDREERRRSAARLMQRTNPSIIPRNHRVEEALEAALEGDMEPTRAFVKAMKNPYAYSPEQERFVAPAPATAPAYVTYCGT